MILHRHKNALKVQLEAMETTKEIQQDYSFIASSEVIQQWLEEEKMILVKKDAPKITFQGHEWMVEYFLLLRKFYALRENVILLQDDESCDNQMKKLVDQLLTIEKRHKIPTRWKSSDQEFQNTLVAHEAASAKTNLELLLMSGRRRWFLLSLVKKYADGQAQAYRILKAVTNETKKLKNLLKKYNASVQILKEHGRSVSTLSWEEVTNVASSSLYSGLANIGDHKLVPDAIKREVVDAYNLCQRAGEELGILYQEMSRVIVFFYEDCKLLERKIAEVTLLNGSCSGLHLGVRSVLLTKLAFCQQHLLFAVESFKTFVAIPTDIDDYLKINSDSINISCCETSENDEFDLLEDVISPEEIFKIDNNNEKDDYLFGGDEDSGFGSTCM